MFDALNLLTPHSILSAMSNAANAAQGATQSEVRGQFFTRVAALQPLPSLHRPGETGARPRCDLDEPLVQRTASYVMRESTKSGCSAVPCEKDAILRLYDEARAVLAGFHPDIVPSIDLLVHTFLFVGLSTPSYGGASFAELPGLVWIRPDPHWTPESLAESMLHEGVHQAVFLLDMAFGLFEEAAFAEDERFPSAVRAIYPSGQEPLRTFWATYHAACVARWLIAFFEHVGADERAAAFRTALSASLPLLQARTHLLTVPGRMLLASVADELQLPSGRG